MGEDILERGRMQKVTRAVYIKGHVECIAVLVDPLLACPMPPTL